MLPATTSVPATLQSPERDRTDTHNGTKKSMSEMKIREAV
jgi:hypothetical protein